MDRVDGTPPWVARELPALGSPDLWLLRVSDAAAGALDEAVLDVTERRRAAALVHGRDRVRFTAAHVALRRLLGAYLRRPPEEIRFGRETCPCCGGPHGRPTVLGPGRDELFFSLSHRGDLALVGTAAVPIGVDVDLVADPEAGAELATMLHRTEQRELAALPPALRPRALARLWTRKEAYLKGLGSGLGRDPSLDYVGSAPGGPAPPAGWTLLDVPVDRGYAAAVAVRGELAVPDPTVVRLEGPLAAELVRAAPPVLLTGGRPS
ncbi:4'-phosphopantetheinyl transferase superfamily protein [Streptomyces sp. NBC_00726]|uniref:4'-phosphopantetheinyl transferase family protein n=1 Tax=Streptomyces sp. NBC_00726 TaxID=2903674 RepID=UPI00386FF837